MNSKQRPVFESLYKEYYSMVFQLCLGFVKGDRPQADDLSQEVFINIWNGMEKFQGKSSYKTWIYRITVNTCLQFLRKDRSRKSDPIPGRGFDITDTQNEATQNDSLYNAIGKLEELDRLIIMMVLDELSYSEIATVLGISEVNLRVKIHRIKAKLKKIMRHE